jgi:hypothetical protein
MSDTTILPFSFPAVGRKKITAAFDGGRLTSDGGVMLLALADRRVGVAEKLSCAFPEWRDRSRIVHSLADVIRARIFAIACGYEDGNDLDRLRNDPAFISPPEAADVARRVRAAWAAGEVLDPVTYALACRGEVKNLIAFSDPAPVPAPTAVDESPILSPEQYAAALAAQETA